MKLVKDSFSKEILLLQQQIDLMRKLNKEEMKYKDEACDRLTAKIIHLEAENNQIKSSKAGRDAQQQRLLTEKKHVEDKLTEERIRCEKDNAKMINLQQQNSTLLDEIISLKGKLSSREQASHNTSAESLPDNTVYFKGETSPLSNLYPADIAIYGINFKSSEAAYQWRKAIDSTNLDTAAKILEASTAREAMSLAKREIAPSLQWDEKKEEIMKDILMVKWKANKKYRDALRATGAAKLIENTGHRYWGDGGLNKLGQLHMHIRDTHSEDTQKGPQAAASESSESQASHLRPRCSMLVLGNSLTKNLKLEAEHIVAPTIEQASRDLEEVEGGNCCIIQGITNEIRMGRITPRKCADTYVELAKKASHKFHTVILSMSTPHADPYINDATCQVDRFVTDALKKSRNIICWFHSNMFHKDESPKTELLRHDGYHLNAHGARIYRSNIDMAIHKCCN